MIEHTISIQPIVTGHLCCELLLNDKPIFVLIDTGASNSCIGHERVDYYKITLHETSIQAAGAGSEKLQAQKTAPVSFAAKNGEQLMETSVMVLDLDPVNATLAQQEAPYVDGILGADILQAGQAIIDYEKYLLRLKF